jgi:hypothetical protein
MIFQLYRNQAVLLGVSMHKPSAKSDEFEVCYSKKRLNFCAISAQSKIQKQHIFNRIAGTSGSRIGNCSIN